MLKWIKAHKKIIITLSFAYVYLIAMLTLETPYSVVLPDQIYPIDQAIEIEGYEMLNNFYTVTVISMIRVTPFQAMIVELDPQSVLRPLSQRQRDLSLFDEYKMGQVSKEVSYQLSIIHAYEAAMTTVDDISISYAYEGLLVYYRPSRLNALNIGDQIIKVNEVSYQGLTHQAFLSQAMQKEVVFTVLRNASLIEISYKQEVDEPSLIFYPKYVIHEANPKFSIPGLKGFVGGPSGGLMQSLSIYASLVKLNIGNLKIAGTGTIEIGGSVGRVGGIPQKLYTAKRDGVDIFLLPQSQEELIPNHHFPFKIILVNTLEEAYHELYQAILDID